MDEPCCALCDQVITSITFEDFGPMGSEPVSHPCGHITVNFERLGSSCLKDLIRAGNDKNHQVSERRALPGSE